MSLLAKDIAIPQRITERLPFLLLIHLTMLVGTRNVTMSLRPSLGTFSKHLGPAVHLLGPLGAEYSRTRKKFAGR